MTTATYGSLTRFAMWFLRRNPFYLISAVAMAVGARLFLVGSGEVAGDVRLILQTFAILQVYEWAVTRRTTVIRLIGPWLARVLRSSRRVESIEKSRTTRGTGGPCVDTFVDGKANDL